MFFLLDTLVVRIRIVPFTFVVIIVIATVCVFIAIIPLIILALMMRFHLMRRAVGIIAATNIAIVMLRHHTWGIVCVILGKDNDKKCENEDKDSHSKY